MAIKDTAKSTVFPAGSSAVELGEIRTRFVVGIDLGTTNSALCYVDLDSERLAIQTFSTPQAVAPGVVEERPTLPSFFARFAGIPRAPWEADDSDFSVKGGAAKDGRRGVVGAMARDFGVSEPESFVSSAKSWLCHSGVDRTAKILPWSSDSGAAETTVDENVDANERRKSAPKRLRWSPVEVSSFYLRRLRDAWNVRFPEFPLETQDVSLTIPASFDETARELTIDAAKLAGLPKITLVEEPQAAFYSWLAAQDRKGDGADGSNDGGEASDWTNRVKPGDKILVCDVGGGTTDFASIYALKRDGESAQGGAETIRFYRVAVGDHLILGGDNLDLAVYRLLEQKIAQKRKSPLTTRERAVLLRESREIKERFLGGSADGGDSDETRRVVLPGSGAKLVGGGTTVDVRRSEIESTLIDGFFPRVPLSSVPTRRRGGVREVALPYATDPAITKHLARFLTATRDAGARFDRSGDFTAKTADSANRNGGDVEKNGETSVDRARPDVVLFNGGAFESAKLRTRIVESLVDWFGGPARSWRPVVLQNADLYLAVARGAAYYGLARRGLGTKIGASLARTYYIGVDVGGSTDDSAANSRSGAKPKAVCLLPARCEPGDEIALPRTFELAVDRPVAFPIFASSVRTTDAPGDLVEIDPTETRTLPPIRTALKTRSQAKKDAKTIRVKLVARPTEIGTIEAFLQEVAPENADETGVGRGGETGSTGSKRGRLSRWTLQFDARAAIRTDLEETTTDGEQAGTVDEAVVDAARRVLTATFATNDALAAESAELGATLDRIKPGDFWRKLTDAVGTPKSDFPITLLRRLADATLDVESGRRRSAALEARLLNWLGYALRPGFGVAADDWRIERAWKALAGGLAFGTPETRTQYWVLWRRVASGLSAGRQRTLAEPLVGNVRDLRRKLVEGRGKGPDVDLTSQEGAEIWRLLGALELLDVETKTEIGDAILDVVEKKKIRPIRDALVWALGRLGARIPFNAPLDRVVPGRTADGWARRLLGVLSERATNRTPGADWAARTSRTSEKNKPASGASRTSETERAPIQDSGPTSADFFALGQLTRKSGDSNFDVSVATRDAALAFLTKNGAADSTTRALTAFDAAAKVVDAETTAAFGESLPLGLRWN